MLDGVDGHAATQVPQHLLGDPDTDDLQFLQSTPLRVAAGLHPE
jgi:hypothetical protein